MTCPDDNELDALFTGGLSGPAQRALEVHLDECNACRRLAAEIARLRGVDHVTAPRTLGPAARVGRYLIVRLLGRGGMGEVWSAVDPELDRLVAVKVVEAGAASETGEASLLREAQTLARVSHPNVVQVYDVGRFGARVFIAMERFDGGTLDQWVSARPRSWRDVLQALCAAGDGLAAAHRVDVVHRDFKPRNVLVTEDGRVCVSDFGLAASRGAPSFGGEGPASVTPAGTETYLAPEQREGTGPSALSDQFSFCVAANQLLPDAPRRIATILRRGLQPDPSARHPDMDTLVGQLRRAASPGASRWTVGLAAAAAGLIGAGVAYDTGARGCEVDDPIATAWDSEARGRVEAALDRAELDEVAADGVVRHLDGWVAGWRQVHAAACPIDLRTTAAGRCLSRRREELTTTLAWLESGKAGGASPVVVVRALSPVESCADGGPGVVVPRPEAVEGVADLSPALGRVSALIVQERLDEAEALLVDLETRADALGHPTTSAHVALRRAVVHGVRGRYAEQRTAAEAAAAFAVEGRDDELLASAWMDLLIVEGLKLRDHEAADRIQRWLGALLDAGRVGPDGHHRFWRSVALIEESRSRSSEALAAWDLAIAAAQRRLRADDPWLAEARMHAAMLRARVGVRENAKAEGLAALRVTERVHGPNSGYTRRALVSMTHLLLELGLAAEATTFAARARSLAETGLPLGHPDRAAAVYLDGKVRMQVNPPDYAAALARFEQARDEFAMDLGAEHPAVLTTELNVVIALNAVDRVEPAHLEIARLLPRIEAAEGADSLLYGWARATEAATLFNLERYDAALLSYEVALPVLVARLGEDDPETMRCRISIQRVRGRLGNDVRPELQAVVSQPGFDTLPPELRARTRFALAEAVWAFGDPNEAIALAQRVAAEAREHRLPPAVANEVAEWLGDPAHQR